MKIGSNNNLNKNLFVNAIFKMGFKLPTLFKSLESKQHQYKQLLKYNIIAWQKETDKENSF